MTSRDDYLERRALLYRDVKFRRRLRVNKVGDWYPGYRYGVYLDNQNIMIHWGSHCWQITWFQEIVQ